MSTDSKKVGAAAPKGTVGFGIKKETRGASQLKFKPDPTINDGLCLMFLKEITIGSADYKDDQKGDFAEFAGKSVPTLNFVFEGFGETANAAAPVYIHSYKPMVIIPNSSKYDWFYNSMFQTIKHFIDVLSGDNFRDEYEELLALAIDLENGMEFEPMIAAYNAFFAGVKTVFDGNDKLPSLLVTEKKEPKVLWGKLLLYNNGKEVNNGNFGFSGYPGEGLIELWKKDTKPALSINIAKGESIIPKEKKDNTPTPPPAGGSGVPGAAAVIGNPAASTSKLPDFMKG